MKTVRSKSIFIAFLFLASASMLHAQMLCNAQFTFQPGSSINTINFFSNPQNSTATQYNWSFGDGGTSSAANPHHTFVPGVYNVCLTITVASPNGTLCTANYCDSVHVPLPVMCHAQFIHQQTSTPNTISFVPAQNTPGTIYHWTFGDGDSSALMSPQHTYAPGNYLACLTVVQLSATGAPLCTDTWCDSVHVGPINIACNANFNVQPIPGTNSLAFTPAPNPQGTQYLWTFGDGDSSHMQSPHHAYAPGNYQVCLTVTVASPAGILCTDTWCDSLHIPAGPSCNAHFTHQQGQIPNLIQFNSFNNPPNTVYSWSFGDGGTANVADPHHIYAPGHYNACLTVTTISPTGTALCTATWCDSIHIANPMNCHANFLYTHLPAPLTYSFTNLSSPNATGYFWHFGDGTVSMQQNPVHQYAMPGHYQVCVTMIDTVHHCSRTRCRLLSAQVLAVSASESVLRDADRQIAEEEYNISVFPNPATEKFTVTVDNTTDPVEFIIYDETGRVAYSSSVTESAEIDATDISAGLYFYKATIDGRQVANGKLIIQK